MLLTPKIIAVKIVGKMNFADLAYAKSVASFLLPRYLYVDGMSHIKTACLPSTVSKVEFCASFENHFFRIARALEWKKKLMFTCHM